MNWPQFDGFNLKETAILITLAGSRSYGTDHPLSDYDYKGIVIPPRDWLLSPYKNFEQTGWKVEADEEEGTLFSLEKFMKLAADCNPNVIETLYADPAHIQLVTDRGERLLEHRDLFLSKRAVPRFVGYGMSQLKRIQNHKRWLDNPPKAKPTREDFGLPPLPQIADNQLNAVDSFVRRNLNQLAPWLLERRNEEREDFWESFVKVLALVTSDYHFNPVTDTWHQVEETVADIVAEKLSFDDNFVEYLKQERKLGQALHDWDSYQSWLRNRNPARAELEARYGYDCKHAMHLVRLLRMGAELTERAEINVFRPDREELIEIRNGSWKYEDLIDWAKTEQERIYDLSRSPECPLPRNPPQDKLEALYMELV